MRKLALGTLTTLLLTFGIAPVAQGETFSETKEQALAQNQQNVRSTEAFDLVAAAYRGQFKSQSLVIINSNKPMKWEKLMRKR
ncbi:hypothetical protein Dacsa_2788 [Dactylococcopsis salina PCC 8305]|uniref:Uncharacterized protein n=2 Tax=Dactylococcopsis salina TaxID=292566 RepID=K9YZ09_DACS8|nr:hypothetical protein Dacsa_2788 [Dactylococcopsis salina PCC 8305]